MNGLLDAWLPGALLVLDRLWQTSWQAGLIAGAVWLACRRWPRLPASLRLLLWWLVCLKFVAGLAWPQPLAIAILPAAAPAVATVDVESLDATRTATRHDAGELAPASRARATTRVAESSADPGAAAGDATTGLAPIDPRATSERVLAASPTRSPAGSHAAPSADARTPSIPAAGAGRARAVAAPAASALAIYSRYWPLAIAGIWLIGLLAQIAALARQHARTRALLVRSQPVEGGAAGALFGDLCSRLQLSPAPALRASADIRTPQVTGLRHPIVLIPTAALDAWSRTDLALTLGHELLHVRRRDLWHGWIPSAAARLFFVHPLARLAAREYALAREAVCDARVLHLLDAPADEYGRLLVRLGVARRDATFAAAGASASLRTLKRRLIMLHDASLHARALSPRGWIVAALAALAVLPIRLVASPATLPETHLTDVPSIAAPVTVESPIATQTAPSPSQTAEKPAQRAQRADKDAWDDDEPWVLLDGDSRSMSGTRMSHVQMLDRLRTHPSERLLWFVRNGRAYVVRDPALLAEVHVLFEPQRKLGEQQGALGEKQGALGDKQGKLGEEQGRLGARQGELGAKQGELGAKMAGANADLMEAVAAEIRSESAEAKKRKSAAEARMRELSAEIDKLGEQQDALGREQDVLGKKQDELGRQQDVLGREQDALGRQQDEAARVATRGLRALMDRAIASGLAKPMP